MSAYRVLVAPGLLLAVLGSSCPRGSDLALGAPTLALAEIPTVKVVAPMPTTGAPAAVENRPAVLDPVTLTEMPPELSDPSVVEESEVEAEAPTEAPAPNDVRDTKPRLSSVAKETWLFAEPRWKARTPRGRRGRRLAVRAFA